MNENLDTSAMRIFRLAGISNKKKLFERLAEILALASDDLTFEKVLDNLTSRERMGSTCIGDGVAIPHCKCAVEEPIGAIVQLDEAIPCNNKDDKVSLIFGLVIPEDQCQEHLTLLSEIATFCRTENSLQQINSAKSESQLRDIFTNSTINLTPYKDEVSHT